MVIRLCLDRGELALGPRQVETGFSARKARAAASRGTMAQRLDHSTDKCHTRLVICVVRCTVRKQGNKEGSDGRWVAWRGLA